MRRRIPAGLGSLVAVAATVEREEVVAAAAACFATYGFKATTLEHVAERAGTSSTTVKRLVGGRQRLIDAVLVAEAVGILEHLAPLAGTVEDLDGLIGGVVTLALEAVEGSPVLRRAAGPDIGSLLFAATTSAMPMVSTLASGGRLLMGDLRTRLGSPDVDPAVFDELIEDLIRYILALLHTPTIDGRGRDPEVAAARAVRLFAPAFEAAARSASSPR